MISKKTTLSDLFKKNEIKVYNADHHLNSGISGLENRYLGLSYREDKGELVAHFEQYCKVPGSSLDDYGKQYYKTTYTRNIKEIKDSVARLEDKGGILLFNHKANELKKALHQIKLAEAHNPELKWEPRPTPEPTIHGPRAQGLGNKRNNINH